MAVLKDLMVEDRAPASACLGVSCGDCLHFTSTPLYVVGGRKVLCSNERVGRTARSVPCPNFALDTALYRRVTPDAALLLSKLLLALGLGIDGKRSRELKRDAADLRQLIKLLMEVQAARSRGYELGSAYTFTDSSGTERTGKLTHVSARTAVVVVDGTTPWTVRPEDITPAVGASTS